MDSRRPHDMDVQELLRNDYEEVEMEATFRGVVLEVTRRAVSARARARRRLTWAFAATAAVLLSAFGLWSGLHRGTVPPIAQEARGPLHLVVITARGDVRDGAGRVVKVGDRLSAGARVRTGKASYLVMVTRRGSGLALDAASELAVARDGRTAGLVKGQLYCRNWKHEFAAITTPAGKIQLLGTVIDAAVKAKDRVSVTVVEGRVKLANTHGAVMVPAGRRALLLASAAPEEGEAANVLADTAWVEGTLYFRTVEQFGPGGVTGESYQALTGGAVIEAALPSSDADPSPSGDPREVVWAEGPLGPTTHRDIFVQRADGTVLNVTARAGLGGLNCLPKWSPDARMIVFQHVDSKSATLPCGDGFRVWVMDADGSHAHLLLPGGETAHAAIWDPGGRQVLVKFFGRPALSWIDLNGNRRREVPHLLQDPVWSPDATRLAATMEVAGTKDGRPGLWRQLVVLDVNSDEPRVLVEQFLAVADFARHYPTPEQMALDRNRDWIGDGQYWSGPVKAQWSPDSTQIAFLAALPYDPEGAYYRQQDQVWIYDLPSERLVQVTYGAEGRYALVWSRGQGLRPGGG